MRFLEMLEEQDRSGMPRTVFFTDIDNTFRMKDGSLAELSLKLFNAFEQESVPIAGVTGVPFSFPRTENFASPFLSIEERVQSGNLPPLPGFMTEVGTRCWWLADNGYVEDGKYAQLLRDKGFEKEKLHPEIASLPLNTKLILQPNNSLEPFKLSYFLLPTHESEVISILQTLRKNYPQFRIAAGIDLDDPQNQRYWLDILPLDKSEAVANVIQKYSVVNVFRAGDSPNDESMLLSEPVETNFDLSIVVGGAEESLHQAAKLSNRPQLYLEEGSAVGPQSIIKAIHTLAATHPVLGQLSQRLR